MNPSPKNETDSLRSDIDVTRRRMDDTMDALGDRLQPRHLVDEVLGFFRGNNSKGEPRLTEIREKITESADTAVHAVVDTVKKNPVPVLLIGAGVAWMIYESRRDKSGDASRDYSSRRRDNDEMRYDPDTHYDRPLEYPPTLSASSDWDADTGSKLGEIKDTLGEKASAAADQVKEKLSDVGDAARDKFQAVKQRAGEVTAKVKDSTREAYTRTRERVSTTVDHHPLEVGLVALAAGVIAGLALPTPNVVNRTVGESADRLRSRTREAGAEMLEKGKRVAKAAVSAVKDEAEAQGLTPEMLKDKATAVAERATDAGKETARQEGLAPASGNSWEAKPNPSIARPGA